MLVPVAPPNAKFVAYKFVLVVFVPVAFVQIIPVGLMDTTIKFVNVPFVAKKFVDVAFVLVVFVKIAAAGVVRPRVVPLMEPPEIATFDDVRDAIVAEFAFKIVPEATPVQAKLVDVAPVEFAEKAVVRIVVA